MKLSMKNKIIWLTIGLGLGLLFMGLLRLSSVTPNVLTSFSGLATPGYVIVTIVFTILLVRAGLPLNRFGFGLRLDLRKIVLAIAAVIVLRIFDLAVSPLIEEFLGSPRDLQRFSHVQGSITSLIILLIINWTLAAFGEEFAYRIVLMRGFSFIFGDKHSGQIMTLVLQAVMFGLIHAYQGPAGIAGSTFSGLVFGTITILSRWSIWPAALAHGINNTFGIIAIYQG